MFGWIRKKAVKEHVKLMHQNYGALQYMRAFVDPVVVQSIETSIKTIYLNWVPGELLEQKALDKMLDINMQLRRFYDQTPGRYVRSFDDEFVPILGWKRHLEEF